MARSMWQGNVALSKVLAQIITIGAAILMTHAAMYRWFGFDIIQCFNSSLPTRWSSTHKPSGRIRSGSGESPRISCSEPCRSSRVVPGGGDGWLVAGRQLEERLTEPVTVVSVGVFTALLAIDLIGVNRGEVIRLWIFLACFFQIPAAYVCARLESRAALALVLTLTVLQGALGTAMIGFIVPG